jgi:hypothetical protein
MFLKIIIIIVPLVLAGVVYILIGNPFSSAPAPEETAPPAPVAEPPPPPTKPPAPGIEEKIADFGQAVADVSATGESKEVTLVFTEAEVNQQTATVLTQVQVPEDIPVTVKGVSVDLQRDNNILTEVETVTYGVKVTIKVKTRVGISDGQPEVEVTDVNFGIVPLPETIKDRITDLIVQQLDTLMFQLTEEAIGGDGKIELEFKEINIQEEEITITVIIKPGA